MSLYWYIYEYLSLWDIYIIRNSLVSTFQCKLNHVNPSSHSWNISQQSFYSYWWSDISVFCCCFYISHILSSSQMVDLGFLYSTFYFYCLFNLFFYFLFLEQLGLGMIGHAVTSVTIWWHSHKTWENLVEDSRTKWHHTIWTPHVGLMEYTWLFRVGCTVVSTDHL